MIDFIFYFLTLEILCIHHVWTQPQVSSSPLTLCRTSSSTLQTGPKLLLLLARSHSCWKQLWLSLFDDISITVSENQDKISCVQSLTISTMLEGFPGQMVHSWASPLSALLSWPHSCRHHTVCVMSSVHVFLFIALPACLIQVTCVSDANTKLLASTCFLLRQATASQAFGFAACLIASSHHNVGSTLISPSAPPRIHRAGWQHLSPTDYSVEKPILGTFTSMKPSIWI